MRKDREPNWQPLSQLPMIAGVIDGELAGARDQYANLLQAKPKPHVLDDALVGRIIKVRGEQRESLSLFKEQATRWRNESTSADIVAEVDRLDGRLDELHKVLTDILVLAGELQQGTIEKVLAKSDVELAIEYLLHGTPKI